MSFSDVLLIGRNLRVLQRQIFLAFAVTKPGRAYLRR